MLILARSWACSMLSLASTMLITPWLKLGLARRCIRFASPLDDHITTHGDLILNRSTRRVICLVFVWSRSSRELRQLASSISREGPPWAIPVPKKSLGLGRAAPLRILCVKFD